MNGSAGRVVLRAHGERCVITNVRDHQEIGFVVYRAGIPGDGWVTIADMELEAGHRGWGYGAEAVRLLEEVAVERGLGERFRADVDAKNGLGLYFWLRLGYRPAMKEEAFWREPDDGDKISMIRVTGTLTPDPSPDARERGI